MTPVILDQLRRSDPAASVPNMTADRADALLASILTSPTDPPPQPSGARVFKRPRARWSVGLLVAASLALCSLLGSGVLSVRDHPVGATPAAAATLAEAARNAIDYSDPPIGRDQYYRVMAIEPMLESPDPQSDAYSGNDDADTDIWKIQRDVTYYPADDNGLVVHWQKSMAAVWATAVSPAGIRTGPNDPPTITWHRPSLAWIRSLPRDPSELRERLYADAPRYPWRYFKPDGTTEYRPLHDDQVFGIIETFLRSGIVPADLRAALFEVLITIPGVDVTEHDAELLGRTGVAIARTEPDQDTRSEIVLDPRTGAFIGTRSVLPDGATARTAFTTRVVDSPPAEVGKQARRWWRQRAEYPAVPESWAPDADPAGSD